MEHQVDTVIEACARAAHEVNRAHCIALGDFSQRAWEDAPDWLISSTKHAVEKILRSQGPEQEHEEWLAQKQAEGWTYGPVENSETKQHPNCVPYDQLPGDDRHVSEVLLTTTVHAVATSLRWR